MRLLNYILIILAITITMGCFERAEEVSKPEVLCSERAAEEGWTQASILEGTDEHGIVCFYNPSLPDYTKCIEGDVFIIKDVISKYCNQEAIFIDISDMYGEKIKL